ncbi:MAG: hypothetical protein ABWZ40_00255, partial [Caulobacterales bacterium]
MFERDWLRDLALGLIAFALMLPLALLAVGLMAPSGNSDIKSYAQGHIDSSNDPAFQSWANQQAACAEAANGGASEADQRAQDDLCAQFRSAFAAEKMVWLSSRQIFISSLEFRALILSLGF